MALYYLYCTYVILLMKLKLQPGIMMHFYNPIILRTEESQTQVWGQVRLDYKICCSGSLYKKNIFRSCGFSVYILKFLFQNNSCLGKLSFFSFFFFFLDLFIYLLYVSTLWLSSDTPEEGVRSHYGWLWATMWLLGFELRTFGRAVGCSYPLSHLTSPNLLILKQT